MSEEADESNISSERDGGPHIWLLPIDGRAAEEIPLEWLFTRGEVLRAALPQFREHATEVSVGIWITLLGIGDVYMPNREMRRGAKIAVYRDEGTLDFQRLREMIEAAGEPYPGGVYLRTTARGARAICAICGNLITADLELQGLTSDSLQLAGFARDHARDAGPGHVVVERSWSGAVYMPEGEGDDDFQRVKIDGRYPN
jgi:hypothetical protein